jgi:hypothetical protein
MDLMYVKKKLKKGRISNGFNIKVFDLNGDSYFNQVG